MKHSLPLRSFCLFSWGFSCFILFGGSNGSGAHPSKLMCFHRTLGGCLSHPRVSQTSPLKFSGFMIYFCRSVSQFFNSAVEVPHK